MKRCKTEPMRAPFNPEEADVFEARRALQNGDDRPLVEYVRDLAKLGNLLASQCNRALRDVPWDDRPATATAHAAIADESAEWDGSYLQVKEAIEQGNVELLGYFFREVAEFHDELAAVLSGRHYSQWRLKFLRKRRGRPSDRTTRMLRDSRIATELALKTRHLGKQESALADLKATRGISRATSMRAKRRNKAKRESHKMR